MFTIKITSNKDPAFFREVALAEITTIGRDATCNISLPDPEKHISRFHAAIEQTGGNYYLTVTSKTNPLIVNDKPYQHGKSILLNEGDRIVIRSYVLTITRPAASSGAPGPGLIQSYAARDGGSNLEKVSAAPKPTPPSPWEDTATPSFGKTKPDPFGLADLMSKPTAKPDIGPDPFKIPAPAKQGSGLVEGIAPLYPENPQNPLENQLLDPMVALSKRGATSPSGISGNTSHSPRSSPFDDLLAPLSPSSPGNRNAAGSNQPSAPLVDLGGHHPTGTRSLEHVHDINLPYTPPPVPEAAPRNATPASASPTYSPRPPIDDPFADTLKTYIRKIPGAPAQAPQPPYQPSVASPSSAGNAANAGYSQTNRRRKERRTTPSASEITQINSPGSSANEIALLLNAFRQAAGLGNQPISPEEAIAYMESAGTVVRTAIEGIASLLASRSMLKGELGAEDRTMVASRDNNPLKLMPNIEDVMQFLFEKKRLNNAYLTPVQSIAGACEDLVYHELGTAAGIRAAVEGSIRRFNPQLIEAEFDKTAKKIVLNRKASLWETYVENYRKIEVTMADDIGRIFERDFRRAYDDQIRKLKKK